MKSPLLSVSAQDRQERGRGHRQCDVPIPGGVTPDLVMVESGLVLRRLEALLDRPPTAGYPHQLREPEGVERLESSGARAAAVWSPGAVSGSSAGRLM